MDIYPRVSGPRAAALRIPEDLLIAGRMFSRNELDAMAGRSLVHLGLGDCYVPAFYSVNAAVRARLALYVLGRYYRRGDILCRQSAAWVHGLLPHTQQLCVQVADYRRPVEPLHGLGVQFIVEPCPEARRVQVGKAAATDRLLTVCDCLLYAPMEAAGAVLHRALGEFTRKQIRRELVAAPAPATGRALTLLDSYAPHRHLGRALGRAA